MSGIGSQSREKVLTKKKNNFVSWNHVHLWNIRYLTRMKKKNSTRINLRNSEKVEKVYSMKKKPWESWENNFLWFHGLSLILLHHNFAPFSPQISHLQLNKRANESSKWKITFSTNCYNFCFDVDRAIGLKIIFFYNNSPRTLEIITNGIKKIIMRKV